MSGSGGTLANGPESPYVVAALEALLADDRGAARTRLVAAADATSWAAVGHRLDVAGRALARDVDSDAVDTLASRDHGDVFTAWRRGSGLGADVDLTTGAVRSGSELDRTWEGLEMLADLVERSGFPPQVVV